VDRAAQLVALAEDARSRRLSGDMTVTLEDLVRIDNSAARAVRQLGIGATPAAAPAPSLRDYVAAHPGASSGPREASGLTQDGETHHGRPQDAGEASGEDGAE
jgi:hypothetical protein